MRSYKRKTIKYFSLSFYRVFLVLGPAVAVLVFSEGGVNAMGMNSDPIVVDNAIKGQIIKEELRILNNESKEASFEIFASGDIKEWAEFYHNKEAVQEINMTPESRENIQVEITIPSDTPNGEYAGELKIKSEPPETEAGEEESVANVSRQISRDVFITVTDTEIIELKSSISPRDYALAPDEPLEVNAFYYNYGNISLRPDLGLKITREGNVVHNSIYPYPEEKEAVAPLGEEKIAVSYNPGNAEAGTYQVEAVVYLNGDEYESDKFTFKISEEREESDNRELPLYATGFAGIALLTAGGALTVKRFVKHKKYEI
jgi:hypothetical protein